MFSRQICLLQSCLVLESEDTNGAGLADHPFYCVFSKHFPFHRQITNMNFKLVLILSFLILAHLSTYNLVVEAGEKKNQLVVINNGRGKVMYDEGKKGKKGKKILLKSDGCCCKKVM